MRLAQLSRSLRRRKSGKRNPIPPSLWAVAFGFLRSCPGAALPIRSVQGANPRGGSSDMFLTLHMSTLSHPLTAGVYPELPTRSGFVFYPLVQELGGGF